MQNIGSPLQRARERSFFDRKGMKQLFFVQCLIIIGFVFFTLNSAPHDHHGDELSMADMGTTLLHQQKKTQQQLEEMQAEMQSQLRLLKTLQQEQKKQTQAQSSSSITPKLPASAPGSGAASQQSTSALTPNKLYTTSAESPVWDEERDRVCREMMWAWRGFANLSDLGKDELWAVERHLKDTWGGVAMQSIEALSTMLIMTKRGKAEDCIPKAELDLALGFVVKLVGDPTWISKKHGVKLNQFELIIRVVAGLLSAYELTSQVHPELLTGAKSMADALLAGWGPGVVIPENHVLNGGNPHSSPGHSGLAEFTSMQMEFRTLSYHTKDPKYDMAATWLMELVNSQCPNSAECPTQWERTSGRRIGGEYTIGANADSYYEYLVKLYLLTKKNGDPNSGEGMLKEKALKMMRDLVPTMIIFSKDRTRAGVFSRSLTLKVRYSVEELACFVGGMYALAALEYDGLSSHDVQLFTEVAEGVAEQCAQMWFATTTGLAMERMEFDFSDGDISISPGNKGVPYYILRPETLETLFLTYRLTKNPRYRRHGKRIFDAIVKHCRVPTGGYATVSNVGESAPRQSGTMHSFFIAETLKYAFLLFSDEDQHSLEEWVFNTEAHPLQRRPRDPTTVWDDWYKSHDNKNAWCMPKEKFGDFIHPDAKYMKTKAGASLQC